LAIGANGDFAGMTIFNKRNALIGSAAIFFARKYAKRRMHGMTSRLRFR
jgi:hypothetical protein